MLRFATRCFSSGNDTRPLSALGLHNHQHAPQGVHAQRDETLLAGCIGVFDCEGIFIAKRLLGMCKAHTMLSKVAACLDRIELKLHSFIMHI